MEGAVDTMAALCVARCRRVLCRAIVRQRLRPRSSIRVKLRRRVCPRRRVCRASPRVPASRCAPRCCVELEIVRREARFVEEGF